MNIATYLAYLDKKVCIIDTDVNQSSFAWSERRHKNLPQIPTFLAPSTNSLDRIIPVLRKVYDYIIIDGSASNITLTKNVMRYSNVLLVPFLPSPVDWEVTKKMIDDWLGQTNRGGGYTQIGFVINQSDNSVLSKEYPIVLGNMLPSVYQFKLSKKNVYKEIMFTGEALIDTPNKWKDSEISMLCEWVDKLVYRQIIINELILF